MKTYIIKRGLLCVGGIVTTLIVLTFAVALLLCTDRVQQWLLREGLSELSEKLDTRVVADSISIDPRQGKVSLYGFAIDDHSHVEMLHIDTLCADVSIPLLLKHQILVKQIKMTEATAVIYKEKNDSAANFQFIIDAFKSKKNTHKEKKHIELKFDINDIDVSNLKLRWNVRDRLPKNYNRPHRGAFDANHIDAELCLHATLHKAAEDSTHANIDHFNFIDHNSGLDIREFATNIAFSRQHITTSEIQLCLPNTSVKIDRLNTIIDSQEPRDGGKRKTTFHVEPCRLVADVDLRDISKPFAPRLADFTTRLHLETKVEGTLEQMNFKNTHVTSLDKRLKLTTSGYIRNINKDKHALRLHFHNINLTANKGIKEQIVKHFAKHIRLKMVRQMEALGDIKFHGHFTHQYRQESVVGILYTQFGNLATDFKLDADSHLMTGTMSTDSLEVGKLMDIPDLGAVNCSGHFCFDIHSGKKYHSHGRLPIGNLDVEVDGARYGMLHVKRIQANIESDGCIARGTLRLPHKLIDIVTEFTYKQTDEEQSFHFHPKLQKHKVKAEKTKKSFFSIFKRHKKTQDTEESTISQ